MWKSQAIQVLERTLPPTFEESLVFASLSFQWALRLKQILGRQSDIKSGRVLSKRVEALHKCRMHIIINECMQA